MNTVADPFLSRATHGSKRPMAQRFWSPPVAGQRKRAAPAPADDKAAFQALVEQVAASPGTVLFDAVEAGVPTAMVGVIAGATGESLAGVMDMLGLSMTTFKRKDDANEPLPDVAGHRVMALLRVVATLRRLLADSGDARQLQGFDLERWVAGWLRQPLPELDGKTPAALLRNPEGQRAVEQLLERMRGGLPA